MSSEPLGITGVIYQEILQGADSIERYEEVQGSLWQPAFLSSSGSGGKLRRGGSAVLLVPP
jgi:hypothetical protein